MSHFKNLLNVISQNKIQFTNQTCTSFLHLTDNRDELMSPVVGLLTVIISQQQPNHVMHPRFTLLTLKNDELIWCAQLTELYRASTLCCCSNDQFCKQLNH